MGRYVMSWILLAFASRSIETLILPVADGSAKFAWRLPFHICLFVCLGAH